MSAAVVTKADIKESEQFPPTQEKAEATTNNNSATDKKKKKNKKKTGQLSYLFEYFLL